MNRDRFSVKRNREMCTTTSHEHEFVQVDEEVGTLPSSLGFSLRFFIHSPSVPIMFLLCSTNLGEFCSP